MATSNTGRPSSRKGQRQPSSPPARVAIPATSRGLSAPTVLAAPAFAVAIRPRTPIGYVSASIEPCTGNVLDFATPTPKRARKNKKAFDARPHANTISENATPAQPTIRLLR
jgi:hypothetical protein